MGLWSVKCRRDSQYGFINLSPWWAFIILGRRGGGSRHPFLAGIFVSFMEVTTVQKVVVWMAKKIGGELNIFSTHYGSRTQGTQGYFPFWNDGEICLWISLSPTSSLAHWIVQIKCCNDKHIWATFGELVHLFLQGNTLGKGVLIGW